MKLHNKFNMLIAGIMLFGLCACNASVATPTTTLIPILPTSTQPAFSPTPTVIPIIITPSPLPTQPIIPIITPDAIQVTRWKEYEDALAKALFPSSFIPGKFLCEWEILGGSDQEVYLWTVCMSIFSVISVGNAELPYHSTMPLVIHIGIDGTVLSVEIPGGGSSYASDIRRMFPTDAQEKYFDGLIHFQELTNHLNWRREHPEEPPLIILSATTSLSPTIEPTSTEWLPYNPNLSDTGCGEFTATVPIKDAKELSKEKIIKDLFEIYLNHFKSPSLGGRCRLEEFKIENIKMDQVVAFTAKNQWVETTAWVDYSIKIKEVPSNWIAANGELAPDGWIIHKSLIIGFIESDEQYVLILVGGP